jgi:uncharacterized repeat protein (TIGR02543 family)
MKKLSILMVLSAMVFMLVACVPKQIKVIFDPQNGTDIIELTQDPGLRVNVPDTPTYENHTFLGWFIGDTPFDFNSKLEDNVTIVAKWAKVVRTVSFITYGSAVPAQSVPHGENAGVPGTPTRTHYTFSHWEYNNVVYNFDTPVTQNMVIYAVWIPIVYVVSFETSGGTVIPNQNVNSGGMPIKPNNPEKANHTFDGWYIGETKYEFDTPITGNTIIYARWKEVQYTGYYLGMDGLTGPNLIIFLNNLLEIMTGKNYGFAKVALEVADRDPNNRSNIIEFYTGQSRQGVWSTGGTIWNREHVWPQSLLGSSADENIVNIASDLHNLKPSDPNINSSRGNKWFGTITNTASYLPQRTEIRGDIARMLFYMDIRWDQLVLINLSGVQSPIVYQMGDLQTLLLWHIEDPVDDFERNRNDVIFGYQGNRNPFIDHPELVSKIYNS